MMQSTKLLNLLLLAIVLLLGSCKTDPKSQETKTETDEKLTVTSRLRAEPDRLNPVLSWRGWSIQVFHHIFLPMIEHDPFTGKLAPMLAKSRPEVQKIEAGPYAGGIAYTYEILDEAVWDNGQPVMASDYLFTLKAVMNPNTGGSAAVFRSVLNSIKEIKIDSENPRKFTVTVYPASYRGELTSGGLGLLPESIYDPEGLMKPFTFEDIIDPEKSKTLSKDDPNFKKFADQFSAPKYSREVVSGAGAYAFAEWVDGEKIVLKKKENWWGDALVKDYPMLTANPDGMVFKFIPDITSTISLMRNGEVDIARDLPNTLYKELEKDASFAKDVQLLNPESNLITFLGINMADPILSDVRVRKALAHLMDADEVIKTIKLGMASRVAGSVPPSVYFCKKDLPMIDYNIEKAKQLLSDAGWEDTNKDGTLDKVIDGQREELVLAYLMTPQSEVAKGIFSIFQNSTKRAGVQINADIKEANAFRESLKKRDFDLYTAATNVDPGIFDPYQIWHTSSNNPNGANRVGFGTAESDALIEEIRTTLDIDERIERFKELQQMIYDAQPAIFIYNTQQAIAHTKRMGNVIPSNRSPFYFENYFKLK